MIRNMNYEELYHEMKKRMEVSERREREKGIHCEFLTTQCSNQQLEIDLLKFVLLLSFLL